MPMSPERLSDVVCDSDRISHVGADPRVCPYVTNPAVPNLDKLNGSRGPVWPVEM